MLPVAVGAAVLAVLIGLFTYVGITSHRSGPVAQTIQQQYGCGQAEMTTQTHFHTHLAIYVGGAPPVGQLDPVPALVGIQTSPSGTASSFCWLHTHDESGIIHVEAPFQRQQSGFTLNDFLKVWSLTNPDISLKPGSGQKEVVYVNGKVWSHPATSVPLRSLEQIDVEILAKDQAPFDPPKYTWPSGFGA